VLHLDLKPSDVRLAPSGEVKLVDFGSWHVKALEHGVSYRVDGGLHYRAPELLVGRRPDGRADVFSVAAIVYELVAYRKAFPGDSATDVLRELQRCEPDLACLPRNAFTPGFERVLALSLARSPEARHAAFEEVHADLVQLVRETAPRLRQAEPGQPGSPEREELLANVTRARAEDRLEDALEGCRLLLERDSEDEAARRAMTEIEAVLVEREVEALAGLALSYAADGQIELAMGIAEKVERLAPWSPRYLQLQVYLDEEAARLRADALVSEARGHLAAGRVGDARELAREAGQIVSGHTQAGRVLQELAELEAAAAAGSPPAPAPAAAPTPPPAAQPTPAPVAEPTPPFEAKRPSEAEQPNPAPAAAALPAATAPAPAPPPEAAEPAAAEQAPAPSPPAPEAPSASPPPTAPEPAAAAPAPHAAEAPRPGAASSEQRAPAPAPPPKPTDPRATEAVSLSALALSHFLKDEHGKARELVERALRLDPENRKALELEKILRVLG
jgi:tetratricopeptide (TPR) repeat protein